DHEPGPARLWGQRDVSGPHATLAAAAFCGSLHEPDDALWPHRRRQRRPGSARALQPARGALGSPPVGLSAGAVSAPVCTVLVCGHHHWARLRPVAGPYWAHLSGRSPGSWGWGPGYPAGAVCLVSSRVPDPPGHVRIRGGGPGESGSPGRAALVARAGAAPVWSGPAQCVAAGVAHAAPVGL